MRAADGAGIGLGVEAAVEWVVILGLALRTHEETCHRGVRAVIRERFDDGEARAAVGTIGERVPVTTIRRVEDLAQAVGAGGDVGEHQGRYGPAGFTLADFKADVANRIKPGRFEALDGAARWFIHLKAEQEGFQVSRRAFDLNEHALSGIVDPTFEP